MSQLTMKSGAYVKDVDVLYNGLGGVGERELKDTDIEYAKGGLIDLYIDELRQRSGMSKGAMEELVENNKFSKNELANIMVGIDRKMIKSLLLSSAFFGGKSSKANKDLVKFANSNKALSYAKGGSLKGYDGIEGMEKYYDSEVIDRATYSEYGNHWNDLSDGEKEHILEEYDMYEYEVKYEGYAKGGELQPKMQYGSWYVKFYEDENDEEIRTEEVARLIREG